MVDWEQMERLRIFAVEYLTEELADDIAAAPDVSLHPYVSFLTNELAFRVRCEIAGHEMARIAAKYPADWWQAVKERWFPAWAKRRWPVRYTTVEMVAREFYPKLSLPDREDGRVALSENRYTLGELSLGG